MMKMKLNYENMLRVLAGADDVLTEDVVEAIVDTKECRNWIDYQELSDFLNAAWQEWKDNYASTLHM
jgi:hypothetical protein